MAMGPEALALSTQKVTNWTQDVDCIQPWSWRVLPLAAWLWGGKSAGPLSLGLLAVGVFSN